MNVRQPGDPDDDQGEHQSIDPIQDAAVAGYQVAGIFYAESALEDRSPETPAHGRQPAYNSHNRRRAIAQTRAHQAVDSNRHHAGNDQPADESRPGLIG